MSNLIKNSWTDSYLIKWLHKTFYFSKSIKILAHRSKKDDQLLFFLLYFSILSVGILKRKQAAGNYAFFGINEYNYDMSEHKQRCVIT